MTALSPKQITGAWSINIYNSNNASDLPSHPQPEPKKRKKKDEYLKDQNGNRLYHQPLRVDGLQKTPKDFTYYIISQDRGQCLR